MDAIIIRIKIQRSKQRRSVWRRSLILR